MNRREELNHSIAALEAQRAILGPAVVDPALAALRKELAALETPPEPAPLEAALQRLVPQTYAERLRATQGHADPERRLVTILFSDVKGSTAMAETLDPEEVLEVMNGAFEFLIQPIYQHEGTLARLMGDAILAFFGAPLAHENDPERAIRAALEIVAGAQTYAARLAAERGIQGFNVRVGINTGLVVMGEVGSDLRVEYTAMGDAINLAARMEQHAPVGGILISHATYRLVQGLFDVATQPPLMVKGKSKPVQTYVVLAPKARAFHMDTRGIEGIETPMIGREVELARLQEAWRAAQTGGLQFVAIVGEAGLGKSRLLFEFQRWLHKQIPPPLLLKGRAVPETRTTPYGILRDLFARQLDILDSDAANVVQEKIAAGLAPHLPPERAHVVGHWIGFDLSAVPAVQRLAGSQAFAGQAQADLLTYFRALAAAQPLALFLDDLHWADTASLDFITRLSHNLATCRLLFIGLTRPILYEGYPAWGEAPNCVRLNLEPLSAAESQRLVEALLHQVRALPETLRQLIVTQAEGNPFYVEELIKMLLDDDIITRNEAGWQVKTTRLETLKVPATLTGVLQARVDGLPKAEKELLQQASVAGRDFWDTLLLAFNAVERQTLAQRLESVQQRALIYRHDHSLFDDAEEYRFKHIILRDIVYETVLLKLRRRYHETTAQWLEAHSGARANEHAGLIAEHYAQAGNAARASAWFYQAGRAAHAASAYHEAEMAYRRALELATPELQAALYVALGNTLEKLCRYAEAVELLETGVKLAREHDLRLTVEGLTALSWINTLRGDYTTAFTLAGEAFRLAQQSGDHRELGRARMRYCSTHPDYDAARTLACYAEVQADFIAAGDRLGEAVCLLNMGNVCLDQLKDLENAARYYRRSQELFREQGNRWGLNNCLLNLGLVINQQGDPHTALQYYQEALQLARGIDDGEGITLGLENMGGAYFNLGQYAEATVYYTQSLHHALNLDLRPLALASLLNLGEIALRQGAYETAVLRLGTVQAHLALHPDLSAELERLLGEAGAQIPPAVYETALARGQAWSLEEVSAQLPQEIRDQES